MKIDPKNYETRDIQKLMTSCIVPRPIAFVSTTNKNGLPNAAPFCFFTGITPSPPTIAFSVMRKGGEYQKKDTIKNIESSRDFVVNIVDEALSSAMNMASGSYPSDMSEFDLTGLRSLPSDLIKSPRIAEAPISLECKLRSILELGDLPASLVIGEIVQFHIRDDLWVNDRIDFKALRAIGRLGEELYVKTSDHFELIPPA